MDIYVYILREMGFKTSDRVFFLVCNGEKSYTLNKEDIFLCLKDENDKYYEDNMLIYVLLHEVAHSICPEIGHTDLFKEIFDALLDKATEMKIYDKNIPVIKNYCLYKK